MLTVHRAERADVLADVLAGQLRTPQDDPMRSEVIAVPARGVERWLQQRLALHLGSAGRGDGIAANIDFLSPEALLRQVVAVTVDDPEAAEAWYTERLIWPVLAVLDEHLTDPRLFVLATHLSGPVGQSRRLAAATTIARIFSGYGWQRPGMLADWAGGGESDGTGHPLPEPLRWQPWFWREVRARIGQPHVAEQLDTVVQRLRTEPDAVDLPSRVAFFGPTRIPEALRAVLSALGTQRQVSVFLPHPSPALWDALAASPGPVPRPRHTASTVSAKHPLLAALSRDVRELQEVLATVADETVYHPDPAADPAPRTLLAAVQDGLRRDESAAVPGLRADDSLEVHACHGPERQVEVLRDRLLALLDAHPDLQPRDVLIMCPDVEAFAPLIQGAFGQSGREHPGFSLRVRLADRGLAETNEVLEVLSAVLDLAAGRVRSGDLLDLIGQPALARRFGFTDDDLETLAGWVERAGIRWGIDNTQRARFDMGGFPQGTASTGRDRLLLGVLAEESENEWLGVGLPLEGIESTKVDLAGRFAELIDRLGRLLTEMDRRHPAEQWATLLIGAVDDLTETDRDAQWQRAQAIGLLTESLGAGDAQRIDLGVADLRDLMGDLLSARPTRSNFCTGELTVCTLTPMRSVPHRAVILLGMDTGAFPRGGAVDGDDILGLVPMVGERSPRDEDRQVFLDAVTAAKEHLLVFYTGCDPVTGAAVPPPVVVSDLIETAEAVLNPAEGEPGIEHRHTLHAFDVRNFVADDHRTPFSYDRKLLAGARALGALTASGVPGTPPMRLRDAVLAPMDAATDIDLADLISFFKSPTARFVRDRIGAALPQHDEAHPDQLDVALDNLDAWKIGDRFLRGVLAGESPSALTGAELRRGSLPPFGLGRIALTPIEDKAQAIGELARSHRVDDDGDTVDVVYPLPDGRRLYGTVGDVFGDQLVEVNYSSLKADHRLAAWIRLLAIAVGGGRRVREAVVIGAGRGPHAELRRLSLPDDPAAVLAALIAIRDAGLRAPLWLPPKAAEAAARGYGSGRPTNALRGIHGLRSWDFEDDYNGYVLYDDPTRIASAGELIELAGAAPFQALAPVLGEVIPAEDDPTGAKTSLVRMAVAVFGPVLSREVRR
ncbi:exodeoxyribonuclease V subunit gamma [Gordonia phosphorivorans]|uniref:RecBCD enzyme subunit RecC n=1 Tax=Gordonia phosphorivorans TaxID=1056982 RepID=A0ABV6H9J5_9ACTN